MGLIEELCYLIGALIGYVIAIEDGFACWHFEVVDEFVHL
jgi:hypothetical protein|tara:strand:- start:156 stop:275 length:120 start_codon:yes stop_codon:yes gene_type:complete